MFVQVHSLNGWVSIRNIYLIEKINEYAQEVPQSQAAYMYQPTAGVTEHLQ